MLLQKESSSEAVHIKAYAEGTITLNIGKYSGVIFLQDNHLVDLSNKFNFDSINVQLLDEVSENSPEILIVGTGESHKILDVDLIKYLNDKGIAVEAMASRQACHTYEVLSHDRRKVNALIFT